MNGSWRDGEVLRNAIRIAPLNAPHRRYIDRLAQRLVGHAERDLVHQGQVREMGLLHQLSSIENFCLKFVDYEINDSLIITY